MGDLGFSVWRIVRRYRDPVSGTFRVTTKNWRHSSSVTYIGVVSAPGLSPTPTTHKTSEPVRRFVVEGMDLPVIVDRADPSRFTVLWKQVPTEKQYLANVQAQQMQQAAETAARMAAGDTTAGRSVFGGDANTFGGDANDLAQAVTDAIAQAFGGESSTVWGESHVHVQIHEGAPIVGGIPATATVVAVQEVTLPGPFGTMAPGGVADLTLEVAPPDGTVYTTHMRLFFSTPERRARIAVPGTRLPVRIDPNRSTHVEFDKAAFDAE